MILEEEQAKHKKAKKKSKKDESEEDEGPLLINVCKMNSIDLSFDDLSPYSKWIGSVL